MRNLPNIKPNIDEAYKLAKFMQNSSAVGQIRREMVRDSKIENAQNITDINSKRENFYEEIVPKAIKLVNNFMTEMGCDIEDTVFKGGVSENLEDVPPKDSGFVNRANVAVIPKKHHADNFNSPKNTAKILGYSFWINGNTETGTTFYTHQHGEIIKLQAKSTSLEDLVHEYYHQPFFSGQILRNFLFGENDDKEDQSKLTMILTEASVELCKQLTLAYYEEQDYSKNYPNEVALVFHLLKNVAEKLGKSGSPNWKLAIKIFLNWGYKGGTGHKFVELCKNLKTRHFPTGFDIYSVNKFQMQRIDTFLESNSERNSDIKSVITSLKRN